MELKGMDQPEWFRVRTESFGMTWGPVAAVEKTWGYAVTLVLAVYINLYPAYSSLHILPQRAVTVATEHVVYTRVLFLAVTIQSRDIFDTNPRVTSTTFKSDCIP